MKGLNLLLVPVLSFTTPAGGQYEGFSPVRGILIFSVCHSIRLSSIPLIQKLAKILSIIVCVLVINIGEVAGQVVEDTLDASRYFPMEVGNEWHYRTVNQPFEPDEFATWKIEGDTLLNSQDYFIFRRVFYHSDLEIGSDRITYIRYDSLGEVRRHSRFPDGSIGEEWWSFVPCGLDADFNSSIECGDRIRVMYGVFGGYDANVTIGRDQFPAAAFKVFDSLGGVITMVADIGRVERLPEGFASPERLEYVKIGELTYGAPLIVVSNEENLPPSVSALSVYPNPFSRQVTLTYQKDSSEEISLSVFNTLGQKIKKQHLGHQAIGTHRLAIDLGGFSAGLYFFHLTSNRGMNVTIQAMKTP